MHRAIRFIIVLAIGIGLTALAATIVWSIASEQVAATRTWQDVPTVPLNAITDLDEHSRVFAIGQIAPRQGQQVWSENGTTFVFFTVEEEELSCTTNSNKTKSCSTYWETEHSNYSEFDITFGTSKQKVWAGYHDRILGDRAAIYPDHDERVTGAVVGSPVVVAGTLFQGGLVPEVVCLTPTRNECYQLMLGNNIGGWGIGIVLVGVLGSVFVAAWAAKE